MNKIVSFSFIFLFCLNVRSQSLFYFELCYINKTGIAQSSYSFKPINTSNFIFKPLQFEKSFPQGVLGISFGIKFQKARTIIKFDYSAAEDVGGLNYKTQYFAVQGGTTGYTNFFLSAADPGGGGITLDKVGVTFSKGIKKPHQLFSFRNTFLSLELSAGINSFIGTNHSGVDTVGFAGHNDLFINQKQKLNQYDFTLALPVHYSFIKELKPSVGICFDFLNKNGQEKFNISFEYMFAFKYSPNYTEEHVFFNILDSIGNMQHQDDYVFKGKGAGIYLKFSKRIFLNPIWDSDLRISRKPKVKTKESSKLFFIEPIVFNKISHVTTFYLNSYLSSPSGYSFKPTYLNVNDKINLGVCIGIMIPESNAIVKLELSTDNSGAAFKYKINEFNAASNSYAVKVHEANSTTSFSSFSLKFEKSMFLPQKFFNSKTISWHSNLLLGLTEQFGFKASNLRSNIITSYDVSPTQRLEVSEYNIFSKYKIDLKITKPSVGISFCFAHKTNELFNLQVEYLFGSNDKIVNYSFNDKNAQFSLFNINTNELIRSDLFVLMSSSGAGFYISLSKKIYWNEIRNFASGKHKKS